MALSEKIKKEKQARLDELEARIESTQHFGMIAHFGSLISRAFWLGAVAYKVVHSPAEPLKKYVLGALAVFKPWTVWVARALSLDVGTTLEDQILLAAGVVFGLSLIEDWTRAHFEVLSEEADDLFYELNEKDRGRTNERGDDGNDDA